MKNSWKRIPVLLLAAILLAGLALPGCSRRSAGGKKNDAAPFLAGSAEEPVIPPEFDNYVRVGLFGADEHVLHVCPLHVL